MSRQPLRSAANVSSWSGGIAFFLSVAFRQGRTGLLNGPGHTHYAGPGPCKEKQQKAIAVNTKIIKIGVRGAVY